MLKKSTTITFVFIFSTVIQLISQMVVTRMFGATTNLDIFLASVTLPTIFVTLIYSTLNDAFLPLYGDHRSDEYFFSHLALLTFISTIFTGILVFFSPLLADLLYHARGQVFVRQVATQLTIMTWSIPFAVITTLLGSYYYLRKNFLRFPVSQVFGSIFNLIFILLFARVVGIWALILSFILNIIFQIIFIVPKNLFQIKFKTVAIKPLLIAWIPLLIGTFALRSDALIIRSFGSSLPSGYLVYLNLVSKIFSLATSVMTIGLQVVLLPHLIDYISQRDYTHAFRYIFKAKVAALVIAVVITFILITVSPFFINLLFVGGKFTKADASLTIRLLPYFIVPAVGWGISGIFFQPLFALKKQLHAGLLNIVAFFVSWIAAAKINIIFGPLPAISWGLIILLFTGIIGSEVIWQIEKRRLKNPISPS